MNLLRIVFLGNHDVGISALQGLRETCEILGVVCHNIDKEEGVAYKSLYQYCIKNNIDVIRGGINQKEVCEFIKLRKPNLIWVTDYKYIIPKHIYINSKFGAINLHPSLLPKYRGRAPLNWAIIEGDSELGLTCHYIDDGVDTGDIIMQRKFEIDNSTYIGDVLKKIIPIYKELTKLVIEYLINNKIIVKKQNHALATQYPARKPSDGLIKYSDKIEYIENLIRAVSRPYPGAFVEINEGKIIIWKFKKCIYIKELDPGTIYDVRKDSFKINFKDGGILVIDWTSNLDIKLLDYLKIN